MIFWYTGQPGHGKTLHAIDHALRFRDQGRLVYVCNVTDFDHDKAKCLPMTPEEFIDWTNFLPDGAVALVDEAYEHGMLPKRRPGSAVPNHVQQLAKHRHRGIDFIFVCQSPAKQVDEFMHDLIEQHVHVRRRFGTPYVHLRKFDRYERNPEKGSPLSVKRTFLPKRPRGLYKSTTMDTTERSIPWYFIAAPILLVLIIWQVWHRAEVLDDKFTGSGSMDAAAATKEEGAQNGARATVEATDEATSSTPTRTSDYVAWMTPRIPGQPWTAPAYDNLSVPAQSPRVFCMASGLEPDQSCSCLTEQGTRYVIELNRCLMIAKQGQYEPFFDEVQGDRRRLDDATQLRRVSERLSSLGAIGPSSGATSESVGPVIEAPQISAYGDIGARDITHADVGSW
ncbi:zonular occludens toxin family protein [Lysobacter maris]|uniref:Zonular occludens toxin family protein n=1 Tax=Marilutibacter maris TaxID=1605891 RepID=A0A508AU54_9GAMM|nr:zonular occludens toxin domain-containing protein [Lysobacter maris]KAB8191354.1 zonular occludens toxin family protein [Lysobacter maris]